MQRYIKNMKNRNGTVEKSAVPYNEKNNEIIGVSALLQLLP